MATRVRRLTVAIAVPLLFVILAGATYQGVATAIERRQFPRPGGLVDIASHQLHIYCTGKESPVVVLEAGAGSMSAAWAWIQPELAKTTRVCSYDRSALGWSEAGDGTYSVTRVPRELHMLLAAANEQGPFVLVGHELGAVFARMFAARYAADVAAVVVIDDPLTRGQGRSVSMPAAWPWLARTGVLRATGRLSERATGLPGQSAGAMRAFLNRPDHLTRAAMEIDAFPAALLAARDLTLNSPVTSIEIGARAQPAMIADEPGADRVRRVIEDVVREVRDRPAPPSPAR